MEILIGLGLALFLHFLIWLGVRAWRRTLPPRPPQQPRTPTQAANAAVYDDHMAHHPHVFSMRFQRRTHRGRASRAVEEDMPPFED